MHDLDKETMQKFYKGAFQDTSELKKVQHVCDTNLLSAANCRSSCIVWNISPFLFQRILGFQILFQEPSLAMHSLNLVGILWMACYQ